MKVSLKWLQTYFDKPLPSADKLADLFTFHSFEVESVEKVGDDYAIDAKVLPDRAHYALSHKGIAMEVALLASILLKENRIPKGPDVSTDVKPKIKIEAKDFCRRYMGRYVEINEANEQVRAGVCSFLETIGQRGISPIVDATNMVMFDLGQPMHAFDADKVKGAIVVRKAKKGERIMLLDSSSGPGKDLELSPEDHVIADDEGPLAIAGVKGGKRAGIDSNTEKIILESANFEPIAVRCTANRYDLRSDSSKRYENEITPELTSEAMDNVCALLKELYPDAKFGPVVDVYPMKVKQTVIEFDPTYLEKRLGVRIPPEEARKILEGMEIVVQGLPSDKSWTLTIPFNRLDLVIAEDVVEEIGRIYGYEHIQGKLPDKSDKPIAILPAYYLSEQIKNILVGQGFSEVSLYTLVPKGVVETAKPLAKDKAFARANLTDGMMACVERNVLNADLLGLDAIKVFEIGHVFNKEGESVMLSLGIGQVKKVKGVKIDQVLVTSLKSLGETLSVASDVDSNISEAFKSPEVMINGTNAVCEINLTEILESYKLPKDVSCKDLDFAPISSNKYKKFSTYPFIVRDIAVFVPESVQADKVWSSIKEGIETARAKELLVKHSLFDTFKKENKVSYAFRMIFQSMERTLTDDEINKIMGSIYSEMKNNGWEVR